LRVQPVIGPALIAGADLGGCTVSFAQAGGAADVDRLYG
jgi:hypothetical protein